MAVNRDGEIGEDDPFGEVGNTNSPYLRGTASEDACFAAEIGKALGTSFKLCNHQWSVNNRGLNGYGTGQGRCGTLERKDPLVIHQIHGSRWHLEA